MTIDLKYFKKVFLDNCAFVRNFPLTKLKSDHPAVEPNIPLRATFNRKNTGVVITPFVDNCKSALNREINFSGQIDDKEILATDTAKFKMYDNLSMDFTNLNLDILLKAAVKSAIELKILDPTVKFKSLTPENAVDFLPKTTSSCYPLYGKKNDPIVIEETLRCVKDYFDFPTTDKLFSYVVTIYHRFYNVLNKDFFDWFY